VLYHDRSRKNPIKKTADHIWDTERMQFQKEQGNISSGSDYINRNSKANEVKETLGDSRNGDRKKTNTDSPPILDDSSSRHKSPQNENNS